MIEALPLILTGFGLGLAHALDADHVMAVSSLSNQKPGIMKIVRFSCHWALGHGATLLLIGLLLFGLGYTIPESLQHFAEVGVGVLLIALGLVCFYQFRKEKIRLHAHSHGNIEHIHWHDESHTEETEKGIKKDSHVSVMVGGLHGLAGSAPALALVPAVGQGQVWQAIIYLLLFYLGVMLSMLLFGLGFGYIQRTLQEKYNRVFAWSRQFIAALSIFAGSYWIIHSL